MRAYEIVPESWWKDLPVNSLSVMGYNGEEEESPDGVEPDTLQQDVKNLRRAKAGL